MTMREAGWGLILILGAGKRSEALHDFIWRACCNVWLVRYAAVRICRLDSLETSLTQLKLLDLDILTGDVYLGTRKHSRHQTGLFPGRVSLWAFSGS